MKIKPRSGKSIVKKNNNEIMFSVTKTGRKDNEKWNCNLYFPNSFVENFNERQVSLELDDLTKEPILLVTFHCDGEFRCRNYKSNNKWIITFPYTDKFPFVRQVKSCEVLPTASWNKLVLGLPKENIEIRTPLPYEVPSPNPMPPPDAEPYPYLEDILVTLKEIKVLLSSK